ncbi:MAG: zinc ribbon domain-containing protein [Syntrophobacterales bacterium]|nr:MAG: zinc ribbon domain-containing protein [Syntrophobacterales bacterium]
MPIYEYQCQKCHDIFEVFHKIDEKANPTCPNCLVEARRIISPTNFILKGPGFYVTDYPSESRKEGKKTEKEAGKPAAESPKTESEKIKPEKKP